MERETSSHQEKFRYLRITLIQIELQSITSSILRSLRKNSGVDIKKENHQEWFLKLLDMILIFIENNMTLGHFIFLVIVILFIIALIV